VIDFQRSASIHQKKYRGKEEILIEKVKDKG